MHTQEHINDNTFRDHHCNYGNRTLKGMKNLLKTRPLSAKRKNHSPGSQAHVPSPSHASGINSPVSSAQDTRFPRASVSLLIKWGGQARHLSVSPKILILSCVKKYFSEREKNQVFGVH